MRFQLLSLLAAPLLLLLAPTTSAYRAHPLSTHQHAAIHRSWEVLDNIQPSDTLELNVWIKQQNIPQLNTMLQQIADPQSSKYGQWLSYEQVGQYVQPNSTVINAISSFFTTNGAINITYSTHQEFATVYLSAQAAGNAFGVYNFKRFRNYQSGHVITRSTDHVQMNADVAAGALHGRGAFRSLYSHSNKQHSHAVHQQAANGTIGGAQQPGVANFGSIAPYVDLITGLNDFVFNLAEPIYQPPALTNAPYISWPAGDQWQVSTSVAVYCKNTNGTQYLAPNSTSITGPCLDQGLGIQSLTVIADLIGLSKSNVYTFTTFNSSNSKYSATAKSLSVTIPKFILPVPYTRVNFTAFVTYSDGSKSLNASLPAPYSPTSYNDVATIKQQYNIPAGAKVTNSSNSAAIFEATLYSGPNFISEPDLRNFSQLQGFAYNQPQYLPSFVPNNSSAPGVEAMLDIEYLQGIANGVPTTVFQTFGPGIAVSDPYAPTRGSSAQPACQPSGLHCQRWPDQSQKGAYLGEVLAFMANQSSVPLVLSVSYGFTDISVWAITGSLAYIDRSDEELLKLALRGVTVLASSGDEGATDIGRGAVDIGDSEQCSPLLPTWPASSAYVTSVGATIFTTHFTQASALGTTVGSTAAAPLLGTVVGEVPCNLAQGVAFTSGSGFANHTKKYALRSVYAPWQDAAVNGYLADPTAMIPDSSYFNSTSRSYPDVSAIGWNLPVFATGILESVGGTSASTPVVAAMITLINDARLNAGKPPVGFVNPLLYRAAVAAPESFNDIVYGSTNGGEYEPRGGLPSVCPVGYTAAPGYDTASGLGSINFQALRTYAMSV